MNLQLRLALSSASSREEEANFSRSSHRERAATMLGSAGARPARFGASPKRSFLSEIAMEKVRDDEGVITSGRGGRAPQMTSRRAIPAVGKVLETLGILDLPRPLVAEIVRQHLNTLRRAGVVPGFEQIVDDIKMELGKTLRSKLQPVINGTGIVLHTNFGRAPLSAAAVRHVAEIAAHYHNLEFDLASGGRGSRAVYLERCLALA